MDKSTLLIAFLVLVIGFGIGWWATPPEVIYQTDHQQRQIDSLTAVVGNERTSKNALLDSLQGTTREFQNYIDRHRGEVASLTQIRGRLNLTIDSLQRANQTLSALSLLNPVDSGSVFKDTTLRARETFGDSLIEATSEISIKNDSLSNKINIHQLRPVRIDLAILVNEDQSLVESLATSPDFDSLEVRAQTTLRPPKKGLHWSVFVAIGALLREASQIIF